MNYLQCKRAYVSEQGAVAYSFASVIVLVLIGVSVLFFVIGINIPPGYLGIRQVNFGPGQGFHDKGLLPGLQWQIPYYSEVHLVPQRLQLLNLRRDETSGDGFSALEIQTSDRATVDVDATILYRFYDKPGQDERLNAPHGGPAELIRRIGLSESAWIAKIRSTADDALKRTLGRISTAQFYDPVQREKQVAEALSLMNLGSAELGIKGLLELGVEIKAVLLRRYTYREERIENAIFQKNLQDQEEALSVAEGKLSEAQARSSDEEARGEARNRTLRIQAEQDARIIKSEAELYEAKRKAEADLEVAKAGAEIDKLRADALVQHAGGQAYVAKELGALLGSLKGGVVSDIDPYNVDQLMKRLGVDSGAVAVQGGAK